MGLGVCGRSGYVVLVLAALCCGVGGVTFAVTFVAVVVAVVIALAVRMLLCWSLWQLSLSVLSVVGRRAVVIIFCFRVSVGWFWCWCLMSWWCLCAVVQVVVAVDYVGV